jgi:hypothetical protein
LHIGARRERAILGRASGARRGSLCTRSTLCGEHAHPDALVRPTRRIEIDPQILLRMTVTA